MLGYATVQLRSVYHSMLDTLGTNPTQLIGILSFAAASIACFVSGRQSALPEARTWEILALINLLFLLEIFIGLRHRLHDLVVAILMADAKYNQRSSVQEILVLLSAVIVLTFAATFFIWHKTSAGSANVAMGLTIAVSFLFVIETVSLHTVDAVLYRPIASVMIVGWIWAIATCGIVVAASSSAAVPQR